MKRKAPNPDCVLCKGTGKHAPVLVGPISPEQRDLATKFLPEKVDCSCTFDWNNPERTNVTVALDAREFGFLTALAKKKDMTVGGVLRLALRHYQKIDTMAELGYPRIRFQKEDGTLWDDTPVGCGGDE